MFKYRIDVFDKGGLHIDEKVVGLSISQWLLCPLAIWNLLFGMAILLNLVLVKSPFSLRKRAFLSIGVDSISCYLCVCGLHCH